MTTCTGVHLASASRTIDLTSAADSDGIRWSWRTIDGWWEGGTPSMPFTGRPGNDGSVIGQGLRRGRPITLGGVAYVDREVGESTARTRLHLARRKVNEAADLVRSAGTFTVDESDQSRFVTVRRNLRPEFHPQASPFLLEFTVPLVSAHWQKFSTTLKSSSVGSTIGVINAGDADAIPTVHIFGPTAANPYIELVGPTLDVYIYNSGLIAGDELVVDFDAMTAELNGSDVTGNMDVSSDFFSLAPGPNTVGLGNGGGTGTIRVDWHDGWI